MREVVFGICILVTIGGSALFGQITAAPALSFRPINDSTFEIVSQLTVPGHNVEELSRFSISGDGGILTETKTQTEKDTKATSTSVLVFARLTTLTK